MVAFDLGWLIGMTLVVLVLLVRGVNRGGGALVVALYAVFVVVQIGYGR